jgi:hypothetical protein
MDAQAKVAPQEANQYHALLTRLGLNAAAIASLEDLGLDPLNHLQTSPTRTFPPL